MNTETQQQTLPDFVKSRKILMSVSPQTSNPNMEDWRDARHWRCVLSSEGRSMSVYFSQGLGHKKPPTVEDVLDCLASDASGYDNSRTFNDWCNEYGYDTDSRKAEKTYFAVQDQADKLKHFLGESDYETLLWNMERL